MKKNSFLKDQLDDIKQYGYSNHVMGILFTIFYLHVSKKLQLELSIFTCVYWYVACLMMGHFAVHNVNMYKGKKWKYKKTKNDTYFAIPVAGGVNLLTYGIPIMILVYFLKFL